MTPLKHQSNNLSFGTLPVTQTQANGQNVLISFWKPTPEEMMALNTGAVVALTVAGEQMPSVALMAVKP